eukprot:1196349-Prorocentrum_minimum.AAC.1
MSTSLYEKASPLFSARASSWSPKQTFLSERFPNPAKPRKLAQRTNWTHDTQAYSHNGPIGRRCTACPAQAVSNGARTGCTNTAGYDAGTNVTLSVTTADTTDQGPVDLGVEYSVRRAGEPFDSTAALATATKATFNEQLNYEFSVSRTHPGDYDVHVWHAGAYVDAYAYVFTVVSGAPSQANSYISGCDSPSGRAVAGVQCASVVAGATREFQLHLVDAYGNEQRTVTRVATFRVELLLDGVRRKPRKTLKLPKP